MLTIFPRFLFVFLFSLSCWADFEVPPLTGPVVDQVGLLGRENQLTLQNVIRDLYQTTGAQLQVLIVSSLGDEEIEPVATKVFDVWKIGKEKVDNGVLFLIAPKERKLRIEVGRGFEGVLPDIYAKRIISDIVIPYFKNKEFSKGIEAGVTAISSYIKKEPIPEYVLSENPKESKRDIIVFFFTFFLILIFSKFGGGRGGRFRRSGLGSSGWSGGGGSWGGGGGWSGGGGGSAGGGSSGSW